MAYDIFISYRRSDQPLARRLVDALQARGVRVWWDELIEGGEDWRDAIVDNLSQSTALLILFSEACNASKQLRKELAIADTLDKIIVPVLIEDTTPKGHYLYEMAAINWLQIHPNPETKIDGLADRLVDELDLAGAAAAAPRLSIEPIAAPGEPAPAQPVRPTTPDIKPQTVRKLASKAGQADAGKRKRRDFLPFKWYEVLIAVALGAVTIFGGTDPETGEATTSSMPLDVLGVFVLTLLVIAMLVFPFRYYFRRRRVWRAVRAYGLSILVLASVLGVIFGLHPDIADQTLGVGENLTYALVGSILVFGVIALVTFSIYGLLHFQRTLRSFNRNVEAISPT